MTRDVSGDATLPSADREPEGTAATITDPTSPTPKTAPDPVHRATVLDNARYVQLEELGRGGMGRVFAADDLSLGRRIAIKQLLNPTPELIARFERELALTARLQHPGIVTVHDGGTWETGAPAYVMRLVSGQSLEQKVREARTHAERIALLPHAIAAVDAIAYAHAQGIIHRDLKPSNVMVGDYGETVVIDWGLAKDLRADDGARPASGVKTPSSPSSATVAGDVIGTPAYMPPEQAEGREVSERADVYALGALLYHLLSGAAPYQGPSDGVLVQLLAGALRPLAKIAPDVPPDLLAIVGRAMAPLPEDRYASAAELGTELKRFQAGKLVAARQYTAWELFRRWARRRAAIVGVAVAALAVIAVVATISIRRIVREKRQTRDALALAEQHRSEALRRGADAERLVDLMLFKLYDKLDAVGRLDLLEDVAGAVRDHYASGTTLLGADDARKRALIRSKIGSILTAKGDHTGALAELQAAERMLAELVRGAADDEGLAWDAIRVQVRIGESLGTQADLDAPVRVLRAAENAISDRLRKRPEDLSWLVLRVEATRALGRLHERRGEINTAIASYETSCTAATELARRDPATAHQTSLSGCHADLGDALLMRDDVTGARREYEAALAIDTELRRAEPTSPHRRYALMHSYIKVGVASGRADEHERAAKMFRTAIEIGRELIASDPENSAWKRTLSSAHLGLADILSEPATVDAAIVELRAALALRQAAAASDPNDVEIQHDVIAVQLRLAMLLEATAQTAEATREYDAACTRAESLANKPGQRLVTLRELSLCYAGRGRLATERKAWAEAVRWHRAELAASKEAAETAIAVPSDHYQLTLAQESLGDAYLAAGDRAGAREVFTAGRELAVRRAAAEPDNPQWKPRIVWFESALAQLAR